MPPSSSRRLAGSSITTPSPKPSSHHSKARVFGTVAARCRRPASSAASTWSSLSGVSNRCSPAARVVKHPVRVAGESTDFYCTVDFITLPAALTVENARKRNGGKPLASHLAPSADLTHEHMVPCEVVLQELVRAPAGQPLAYVLEPLSYRALVCKKKEIRALESGAMRSALPPVSNTRLAIGDASDPSIPPAFKALMRYDAAGLLGRLLPVTPRAAELHHAYMNWAA